MTLDRYSYAKDWVRFSGAQRKAQIRQQLAEEKQLRKGPPKSAKMERPDALQKPRGGR